MNYYEDFENEFDDEYIEEDPNEDDFPSAHEKRRNNRDDDENVLFQIEQEARELIEQNQYRQGMDAFEKCIEILMESNQDDPQGLAVQEFFDRTIRFLNEIALRLLQEDKVRESMAVLEKCQAWTNPERFGVFPALRSLTFNHIGCCYRRLGKLDKALLYLEKALHFIAGMDKVETRGITHINLCAVLSQFGDHQRALEHASLAVSDCAYDFVQITKNPEVDPEVFFKKAQMLSIAYHNLGTEEEACKNLEGAAQSYFKAFRVAEEHLGNQPQLVEKFRASYEQIKEVINLQKIE